MKTKTHIYCSSTHKVAEHYARKFERAVAAAVAERLGSAGQENQISCQGTDTDNHGQAVPQGQQAVTTGTASEGKSQK